MRSCGVVEWCCVPRTESAELGYSGEAGMMGGDVRLGIDGEPLPDPDDPAFEPKRDRDE